MKAKIFEVLVITAVYYIFISAFGANWNVCKWSLPQYAGVVFAILWEMINHYTKLIRKLRKENKQLAVDIEKLKAESMVDKQLLAHLGKHYDETQNK